MQKQQTRRLRRTALWTAFVLAGLVAVPPVYAQAEPPAINIAAQPLGAALDALAAQAKIKLLYSPEAVNGKIAPALSGRMSPEEALRRLLAGSGLTYSIADGTYAVRPVTVDKVTRLAPIEVRASVEDGYAVTRASTATKTDTPIMQTPASIQVVPKVVLEDKQALSLPDAVNGHVSGVLGRTGGGFLYDNFIIRGFNDSSGFGTAYRNGLINRQDIYDLSNIEQIEILKGPAAVLYGRIEPGGMVNYITKKPLDTPYYAIQQQVGSDHQFRTSADLTGPINEDHTVLYRVNASYTDTESFRDFIGNKREFIAPSLTLRPNKNFEVNVELEQKHDSLQADLGLPAIGNRPAPIPFNRSLNDGAQRQTIENTLFAFDWTYRFNDDWKITQRYQHQDWSMSGPNIRVTGLQADNRTMGRFASIGVQDVDTESTNLDLNGKFELFGAKHNLLIGVDEFRAETLAHSSGAAAPTIDIFNPVYGVVNWAALTVDNSFFYRKEAWSGLYVQDQMTFFEKLHILLGGRHDSVKTGASSSVTSLAAAQAGRVERSDDQFSPRLGVLYQFRDWLSGYASYTESFGNNNGVNASGIPFDPQSAKQYEIGVKTESVDKRFSSSVSLFDLTKNNLLTDDPNSSDPLVKILAGEAKSKGVEVDVAGQVTNKLNLLATYAYTDAKYTQNYDGLKGNRLDNVPLNQASLWGTYQFSDAFKVGLGGVAIGSRQGTADNSFQLPGYGRLDAMLAYTQRVGKSQRLTAQLNIINLLDKQYYANSGGARGSIMPGAPRSFIGSVKLEY